MTQYIPKDAVVAEIERRIKIHHDYGHYNAEQEFTKVLSFLDTLEVKEVKEEPVSKDLEDYANKESESFAEREYEIGYIDWNALAKGYYWGVKAGAQWQKEQKSVEWSEEDERLLSKLQTYVDLECFDRECNGQDLINWLKSLKPQPHWKPSEVQMQQLGLVAKQNETNLIGKELTILYNDLKNLT